MIDQLIQTFAPPFLGHRLVAASLVAVLAWVVANGARWAARRAARTEWLERLLLRSGILSGLVEPSLAGPRRLGGSLIYWSVLLTGLSAALALLSDQFAARMVAVVFILLPNLFLAGGIIAGARWLGRYWGRSVLIWMTNEEISYPWRWAEAARIAVFLSGIALASETTGFATPLIRNAFLIVVAGGTFAGAQAIVIALRSRSATRSFTERDKAMEQPNDQMLR